MQINKFLTASRVQTLLLIFIGALFLSLTVYKSHSINDFYSYDPFYHYFATLNIESQHPFATGTEGYGGSIYKLDYPTLFRPYLLIAHEVTGVDLHTLFKYSGIFFRLLAGLSLYYFLKFFVRTPWLIFFGIILFLFNPYLLYRSLISYPENAVIPFHILVFAEATRSIQKRSLGWILFLYLAFSLLVHYRSVIIPALAVAYTIGYVTWQKYKSRTSRELFRELAVGSLLTILVALPVIAPLLGQYRRYLVENIGADAKFGAVFSSMSQYIPPNFGFYNDQLGSLLIALMVVFLPMGILRLRNKSWAAGYGLFALLALLALVLTRGQQIDLFIPPLRMFGYLVIPIIVLLLLSMRLVADCFRSEHKILLATVTTVVFFISAANAQGWVGLDSSDLLLGDWVNNHLSNGTVLVWDKVNPINIGINHYSFVDPNWAKNNQVLNANDSLARIGDNLRALYPGQKVLILTDKAVWSTNAVEKSAHLQVYQIENEKND